MRTQITCCKGCTSETGRSPVCHDRCETYRKQRDEFEEFKAQKKAFDDYDNYRAGRALLNKDKSAKIKKRKYIHGFKG